MQYQILINDQLYKTITTDNGYNYVEIVKEISQKNADGNLEGFNVEGGLSIKVVQQ